MMKNSNYATTDVTFYPPTRALLLATQPNQSSTFYSNTAVMDGYLNIMNFLKFFRYFERPSKDVIYYAVVN